MSSWLSRRWLLAHFSHHPHRSDSQPTIVSSPTHDSRHSSRRVPWWVVWRDACVDCDDGCDSTNFPRSRGKTIPLPHAMSNHCSFLFAAATALAGHVLAQVQVVAPNGSAGIEGNTSSLVPWADSLYTWRCQHVYDAAHFVQQGLSTPFLIQSLRFRPDSTTAGSWSANSLPGVRIDLATSTVDHLAVSSVFAANLQPNVTRVFEGTVAVQAGAISGSPQPWYIDIPLAVPFLYDPSAGDLVVDMQRPGGGWVGSYRAADAVSAAGTVPPLCSRVATSVPLSPTGTVDTSLALVCQFGCVPITGLQAWFHANTTAGPSPLTVSFTDASYSAAPGATLSHQWDFDGDGNIDSTAANPMFTYSGCGNYTVTLIVNDGVHPPSTFTRPQLVRTDELTVNFTTSPLGSGQWQCTDATVPPATAWAWDFGDDGTIDSTAQNPIAAFGVRCSGAIRLTATRACRTGTALRTVLQSPASQAADTGGGFAVLNANTVGTFFDVQVTAPEGVLVCGMSSATYATFGSYELTVWLTPDTYLNKDGNQAAWRRVARGTGTMNGGSYAPPTFNQVPLDAPFYLAPGNHGLAVYHKAALGYSTIVHTSGAFQGPIAGPDLVLHPSASAPGLTRGGLFSGNTFTPRRFNGYFHYTKVSLNNQGGYGIFGLGCAGSAGVPGNVVVSPPVLGAPMRADFTNIANNVLLFWLGTSRTFASFGPLPFDLGLIGAPGCLVRASFDSPLLLTGTSGVVPFLFTLPNTPSLLAQAFFTQGLSYDPAVNAFGFVSSDAAAFVIGL